MEWRGLAWNSRVNFSEFIGVFEAIPGPLPSQLCASRPLYELRQRHQLHTLGIGLRVAMVKRNNTMLVIGPQGGGGACGVGRPVLNH